MKLDFVAQEVREVFPEAVNEGNDGYLDFNIHPINVAMVNAVQTLSRKNKELEDKIQNLEKLVYSLVQRNRYSSANK